jgi:hypothetical protein
VRELSQNPFAAGRLSEDPAAERAALAWGRRFWKTMRPFMRDAAYSNYLQDEGDERAGAA